MPRPTFARFSLLLVLLLPALARADLAADVDAALAPAAVASADVGVAVIALGDSPAADKTIVSRQSDKPLVPASNLKLVTTGTAIKRLGADFTFRTALAVRGKDVALIGDGDPTLGDAELLKPLGWDAQTVFARWADTLRERGITSVSAVRVDDSIFDQAFFHPNWPLNQASKSYEAQVAGVNLNANVLDFYLSANGPGEVVDYRTEPPTEYATVANSCVLGDRNAVVLGRTLGTNRIVLGGETNARETSALQVTVDDPPLYAGTVLAETLRRRGVDVAGPVSRDRTVRDAIKSGKGGWKVVAVLETPLGTVLGRLNKDSMNLYAEALCKRVGAATTGRPGSWASGTAAMGAFLRSIGVPAAEFSFDGGSGLSRENRVSASALAAVLADAYHGPHADLFFNSLSVAGTDGTLRNRFGAAGHESLRGRVFGKSGYINNVSTLSGYLHGRDGRWYAFSVLMNDVTDVGRAKWAQEAVVAAVDKASGG